MQLRSVDVPVLRVMEEIVEAVAGRDGDAMLEEAIAEAHVLQGVNRTNFEGRVGQGGSRMSCRTTRFGESRCLTVHGRLRLAITSHVKVTWCSRQEHTACTLLHSPLNECLCGRLAHLERC